MRTVEVTTFDDIAKLGKSEIRNLRTGEVARRFKVIDEKQMRLRAGDGTEMVIERTTPMWYEAWFMDRGSVCFRHPDFECDLKAFTEADVLVLEDGQSVCLMPSEELLKNIGRGRHTKAVNQTGV